MRATHESMESSENTMHRVRSVPTHAQLTEFFSTLLPQHPADIPITYHSPRHHNYKPSTIPVVDVVLSITPTPGVYSTIRALSVAPTPTFPPSRTSSRSRPVLFLHRPWTLDRRALPYGSVVLASHKRFDELLTTGWNVALAAKLGLDLESAVCIQGYKGDASRKIGFVGRLVKPTSLSGMREMVRREFGGVGEVHPPDLSERDSGLETEVEVIAIMNAYGADEVERVVVAATDAGFLDRGEYGKIAYVTGEPKDGVSTMRDCYPGMAAICVGHREAEEWGIRWLAGKINEMWSDVVVHTIFEEEEVIPKVKKQKVAQEPKPELLDVQLHPSLVDG